MFKFSMYSLVMVAMLGTLSAGVDDHKVDCDTTSVHQIEVPVQGAPIYAKPSLGAIGLVYNGETYRVYDNGEIVEVQPAMVDKTLRSLTMDEYSAFLQEGGYVVVNKIAEGEFSLKAQMRLNGGGAFGAWAGFWGGKIITHIIHQGVIIGIAACSGPAAPAVYAGLLAATGPAAEATSNVVGWGAGMTTMVATGPV